MSNPLRVILLAAGRGSRLKPLTDKLPKPLVPINGRPLLAYHLDFIAKAGFKEVIVNVSWLAEQIIFWLNNNYQGPLNIFIQHEKQALETGGAISKSLGWLCEYNNKFIAINADIWHDYNLKKLTEINNNQLAHLVLSHNLVNKYGDFCLDGEHVFISEQPNCVFAGISLLDKELFRGVDKKIFSLTELLIPAIKKNTVSGEIHHGCWLDIGTKERLESLIKRLKT